MEFDNTNRGALFKNDKEGNESRPDYKGKLNVEGKDLEIAAWLKTSKSGTKYMSLVVSEPRPKTGGYEQAQAARQSLPRQDEVHEFDEDEPIDLESIPF